MYSRTYHEHILTHVQQSLAEAIKKRREAMNIGRRRLGTLSGLTVDMIQGIEAQGVDAKVGAIALIADALNIVVSICPEGAIVTHELPVRERETRRYVRRRPRRKTVRQEDSQTEQGTDGDSQINGS